MDLNDFSRVILYDAGAGDEVSSAQSHFLSRKQPEELFRRILAEIILLDVEAARERHLPGPGIRILRIIYRF
jgi:hypothetical protein